AHALDARDHAVVVARVLEVDAEDTLLAVLDHLEIVDEALAQQHARDLRLEARRRNVHLAVPRTDRVADAGEKIVDRITDCHRSSWFQRSRRTACSLAPLESPARFDDARDLSEERQLAEADAAQPEVPEIAARPPAAMAAGVRAHLELGRAL